MRFGAFLGIVLTLTLLLAGAFILARYGQGYRPIFDRDRFAVEPTGLLVATSTPDGASIFIDGHLTSATNTTINLPPGEYTVKLVKEGYLPWEKKLEIQKEVVTQTQALLFPAAPRLESLTSGGALSPVVDPTGSRVAFGVASASLSRKNGLFVLDMSTRPILTLRSSSLQIADDTADTLSSGRFVWSPSAEELLVTVGRQNKTSKGETTYRIKSTQFNSAPQDVTALLNIVKTQWQKEVEEKEKARLESLKPEFSSFISRHFRIVSWSPDETKILFEASESATIPSFISPPFVGTSTQEEEREIKKGQIYVYDIKEDKNFALPLPRDASPVWLPDGRHLVFTEERQIKIIEYDGGNKTTVYSGPFEGDFVYPWPDGSKLVILTSLNPQAGIAPNLYTINLK